MSDQVDNLQDAQDPNSVSQPETGSKPDGGDEVKSGSLAGEALAQAALKDPRAKELLRRELQSQKDKAVAEANKTLSQIQEIANALGVSPEKVRQAQRDMVLDSLVNQQLGGNSPDPVREQGRKETPEPASSINVAQAFRTAGYDPSSLTLDDIQYAEQFQSQAELENALLKRRVGATSTKTAPSAIVDGTKAIAGKPNSPEALAQEYRAKLEKIPNGDLRAIANLKVEYRKKGLQIN